LKLWSFSGLGDSSRVSDDLLEKKDLDKRVRALTILTKEDEIPDLTASYFDAEHHLPVVHAMSSFCSSSFYLITAFSLCLANCFPSRIISSLFLALLSQREGIF
jgi:hypothetical protein